MMRNTLPPLASNDLFGGTALERIFDVTALVTKLKLVFRGVRFLVRAQRDATFVTVRRADPLNRVVCWLVVDFT